MAIRVRLDHLLLDAGLTLTELADRVGITIPNLSILKTNKARAIRFSTLEAMCRELGCRPGDLLEWVPEREAGVLDDKDTAADQKRALT
jgi:putative transcriptional regulator